MTRRPLTAWFLSRVLLVALLPVSSEAGNFGDVHLYFHWASGAWNHGVIPGRDFPWEYPPGAALFLLLPTALIGTGAFLLSFVLLMLAVDGTAFALVARTARTTKDATGMWLWVAFPLLLGPIEITRFDLVPSLLAAASVALGPFAPAALALGTATKLWPLMLAPLLFARSQHRARWAATFGGTLAVLGVAAAAIGLLPSVWTTLHNQSDRGVEIESLLALPRLWAGSGVVYKHSSLQLTGSHEDTLSFALLVAVGVTALVLLRRVWLSQQADLALCSAALILTFTLSDKVFSPQYLLWPVGLLAVASARPWTGRRLTLALLCVGAALTHLEYPFLFDRLSHADTLALVVITLRDLVLLAVTGLVWRAAWQSTTRTSPAGVTSPDVSLRPARLATRGLA